MAILGQFATQILLKDLTGVKFDKIWGFAPNFHRKSSHIAPVF